MEPTFFSRYFEVIHQSVLSLDTTKIKKIIELINKASRDSNKLIIAGNGGSAAVASHVAVDFTKAAQIRAINFNEADLITCFSNDYGYDQWVSQALNFYANPGDLAILISSSGQSPNILNGAIRARDLGLGIVALSGFDRNNPLRKLGDIELWSDSSEYNVVEMTHHIWLLAIIDYIVLQKSRGCW